MIWGGVDHAGAMIEGEGDDDEGEGAGVGDEPGEGCCETGRGPGGLDPPAEDPEFSFRGTRFRIIH